MVTRLDLSVANLTKVVVLDAAAKKTTNVGCTEPWCSCKFYKKKKSKILEGNVAFLLFFLLAAKKKISIKYIKLWKSWLADKEKSIVLVNLCKKFGAFIHSAP